MRSGSVYTQVMVQMFLQGIDSHTLSEKTGMSYPTLRRKLRGEGSLQLDEALRIQRALCCDLPLERLFERKEEA
ncbi:MAG: hypothetical protein IJ662_00060 [Clostridia bacterium]|nr:hypothetical protein [Clostridia bacterium]